jgi:hypothetical protein
MKGLRAEYNPSIAATALLKSGGFNDGDGEYSPVDHIPEAVTRTR